jgi:uncharacterized membrane protein
MVVEEKNSNLRYVFALFFLGFLLILVGITVLIFAVVFSGGPISFGGVIIIGPLPIIIGWGPEAALLVTLAIILTIFSIVLFLIIGRKS